MGIRLVVAAVVIVLGLAACGSDDPGDATAEPQPTGAIADTAASEPLTGESIDTDTGALADDQQLDVNTSIGEVDLDDLYKYPDVIEAAATWTDGDTWRFDVTLSSEYDTPERYADAWRILDADDNELGVKVLTHHHADEQPFTRSSPIEVPSDLATVFVEGRDLVNGWSGQRFEMTLAR